MQSFHTLCRQFGQILNGEARVEHGVCSVSIKRNMNVSVQGRLSRGIAMKEVMFESLDQHGIALNMAEIAILPEEIPLFTKRLADQGLIISALHNHWIFTKPNLLYIHFQSVEPPLIFARKTAAALSVLR
ncbi:MULTISPECIES: DUF1259 domain-containing protein [Bacillus]|uniref:DUF1259 domain-containing protein n=1 Tax=Bacillus glycinifermentans TaxID=1664069 RepID=A0AAJ4D4J3_9BACI|nr:MULTISPECIES: DUF1259 domain-containing protein [Bacillus]KKB75185.1 methyltransferase [Bacillus sp. TH008]MBU8786076.1 DUF1259 domain-containing protein [Bacillus glycinifermentans]MDU0071630.1 DUF1259 domain-containing protein [Bacillus sp. IG6]MED8020024.1 DUF1259 domain-containing protein [Bacillus glycinifermentans]NUJ17595.1 DUF1259 domain-containing protein [Bacillus glycinifermentans]